jgi:hypothetical protein
MFALFKPDLRTCTRLISVAAADRQSQQLLLADHQCCWIWMLMEPLTLILQLCSCRTLLPLLLLHATAAARLSAAACPAVLATACPAVLATALLACTKLRQHWELAKTVLLAT